ncbi:ribonuclease R [Propionivibrio sp.]|uniref:ribonuclease R n=1 Tax=Propionivibrio sp. TaxID=2212460 RepID=UPI0025FBF69D|nr:ribonuclease R [Propionivibrio sp.]MBK8400132.1 ribonuclease R [Propionivibrio sp.]MBK8744627.1 ribonuclease R [Propionivibrio sp.]MBK8893822.1 ribonuclease R [Propionivibrio sp.]MBL0207949.1 ribonuclease R [Propionivibrio sp.]
MSIKKLSRTRKSDPFFDREVAKYDHPLPSREYVLQVVEGQGTPVSFEALCTLLDIDAQEGEMFQRRLAAMEREAQLMRNRKGAYIVPERASLIAGRIEGHADGYGFLVPDDGSDDLYLDAKQMSKVLHRDRALVRAVGLDRRGRREGAIVEVLERANSRVVGRVLVEHGITVVVPENRRISQDILVAPEKKSKAKAGQVVIVEIIEQPNRHAQPIGRIVEVLGNYADPGMEIEIALRKHDMPFEFSPKVLEETKALPDKVRKSEWAGRKDLRDLALVTIDGETARDFDDAVFAEKKGRGWRLVVAIADVSHYVRPGMALDREAMERGNSVYFPRRVIPMLPEKLSNGLCSLNPDVERLAMVCDMDINSRGEIKEFTFYPAVFLSRARLTYDQVWSWLSAAAEPQNDAHRALQPRLQALYSLYHILLKARHKRGAIDFETIETMMLFNAQGKIDNIVPVFRNDAHRLIEECMLAANVCASAFLEQHKQPCLYRVHEGPTPEKLEGLRDFLKEFGLGLPGGDNPTAKDYGVLLEKIKPRPDAQLLQTVMLRSLRQAMYSPDNVGHFGLSYEHYTHFTSPIRRYPDLLVHRSIKAVLDGTRYMPGKWDDIGLHCSMTERRADEASRDVNNWLKCYYMRDRIGEEFAGTIASVVPFGVFVALDSVYVEGLVHVSELGEDYFKYDNVKHLMLGERSGQRFRLGDRLQVRLVRADLETGRIDFVLAGPSATPRVAARQPASNVSAKTTEKPNRRAESVKDRSKHKAASKPHR